MHILFGRTSDACLGLACGVLTFVRAGCARTADAAVPLRAQPKIAPTRGPTSRRHAAALAGRAEDTQQHAGVKEVGMDKLALQ